MTFLWEENARCVELLRCTFFLRIGRKEMEERSKMRSQWFNCYTTLSSETWFEISVNMNISVLGFYGYIGNIGKYFDKNISKVKIIQNSWKYLEKIKNHKINKNTRIKVIF